MTCKCDCDRGREVEVTIEKQPIVITVEVPGPRGPSAVDKPFDEDPTEIYLNARGKINDHED